MNNLEQTPIDFVYLWVNGEDDTYINKCKDYAKFEKDMNPERFRDVYDMLKYSIRSLELYVPWFRNIYIFTQSPQVPDWLDTHHPRLKIVHHEDVFDPQYLPTFSSNVIETFIDKIPGLSDHFVYMNDDFLFGKETSRDKFISDQGIINVFGTLFGENFGWRIYQKKNDIVGLGLVEHCPVMMKKEYWDEMYKLWPEKTHYTRSNKFRKPDDLMAHKLYRYYMLKYQRQTCRPVGLIELKKWQIFYKITNNFNSQQASIDRLKRKNPFFYCMNDDQGKHANQEVVALVQDFLKNKYPSPSSFEKR